MRGVQIILIGIFLFKEKSGLSNYFGLVSSLLPVQNPKFLQAPSSFKVGGGSNSLPCLPPSHTHAAIVKADFALGVQAVTDALRSQRWAGQPFLSLILREPALCNLSLY